MARSRTMHLCCCCCSDINKWNLTSCKITTGCAVRHSLLDSTLYHRYTVLQLRSYSFFKKASTTPAAMPVAATDYWWYWLFVIFHTNTAYYEAPVWAQLRSPLRCFLPSAATQTHFQDPMSYICTCGLWKSNQNLIWFFQKYKNRRQQRCRWRQLIPGAATVTSYWGVGWVCGKHTYCTLCWCEIL